MSGITAGQICNNTILDKTFFKEILENEATVTVPQCRKRNFNGKEKLSIRDFKISLEKKKNKKRILIKHAKNRSYKTFPFGFRHQYINFE